MNVWRGTPALPPARGWPATWGRRAASALAALWLASGTLCQATIGGGAARLHALEHLIAGGLEPLPQLVVLVARDRAHRLPPLLQRLERVGHCHGRFHVTCGAAAGQDDRHRCAALTTHP